jgi:hypothetical protein
MPNFLDPAVKICFIVGEILLTQGQPKVNPRSTQRRLLLFGLLLLFGGFCGFIGHDVGFGSIYVPIVTQGLPKINNNIIL